MPGWLGDGVCHASQDAAAAAQCAALHGVAAAGPMSCSAVAVSPDGAVSFSMSSPGGSSVVAGQLQQCPLPDYSDFVAVAGALVGLAVLLACLARIPLIFESSTYGRD